MVKLSFPRPQRQGRTASPLEPDEYGVLDVGYVTGTFCDGRPYRLECWRMEELVLATVFFSSLYLEYYERADLRLLLEAECVINFGYDEKPRLQAALTQDEAGEKMWAVNVQLAAGEKVFAEILPSLRRYVI